MGDEAAALTPALEQRHATPPAAQADVALVDAATIAAVSSVAAGANTTSTTASCSMGGESTTSTHLQVETSAYGTASGASAKPCAHGEATYSTTPNWTLVPSLLLSNDKLLVNEPVTVRTLIAGLAENELPGHTDQLLALLP